jgi:hypothetical protein
MTQRIDQRAFRILKERATASLRHANTPCNRDEAALMADMERDAPEVAIINAVDGFLALSNEQQGEIVSRHYQVFRALFERVSIANGVL